jgi:acetyltransferase-like isoleucine patch superfamily enzyme
MKSFYQKIKLAIILRLGNYFTKLNSIIQLHKIRANRNIRLGDDVHIHPTAHIEIINGGNVIIGSNSEILNGVLLITHGGNIEIGRNCKINPYTVIYGLGNVQIGNDVLIAGHCMIVPDNHRFDNIDIPINMQGSIKKGIKINDNVWIGHACSILDGVEIGSGSIIAAGSVVNKNVRNNVIVGGVPAKIIKERH